MATHLILSIALEALAKRNLRAMFFFNTANIGSSGFVSESEIKELYNAGMIIGTHGHAHLRWTSITHSGLIQELDESVRILEELTPSRIEHVAIPFGDYNFRTVEFLRARTIPKSVYE